MLEKLFAALRLTCNIHSALEPVAFTLYAYLLAAVADGGGEAVEGGAKLTLSSSGLASQLGVNPKRMRKAINVLADCDLLKFSEKKRLNMHHFEFIIFDVDKESSYAETKELEAKVFQQRVFAGSKSLPDTKKEKETKEAVSPQTPFPLERKDKKKERASRSSFEKEKKKKKNKTDFSNSEKEKETDAQPASPQSADGARASLDDRRNAFWQQLQPYVPLYGEDSVKSFFNHWRRCNKNTGIMMFEDDEYFEIEVYLDEWHRTRKHKFSQRRGYRGGGGGGAGETAAVSRGSVAEERAAEQVRQRERIREQSTEQQAESELERLEKQLDYVPPEIISYLKGKGLQPSAMQPDEILTIIKPDELSWDQTRVLEQWQAQRRNVINTIARL